MIIEFYSEADFKLLGTSDGEKDAAVEKGMAITHALKGQSISEWEVVGMTGQSSEFQRVIVRPVRKSSN